MIACLVLAITAGLAAPSYAKQLNVDTILFDPVTDGGRYFSVQDAQTLGQWRWHAGSYFSYSHEPLEIKNSVTGARTGIVNDLIMGHVQGALGFTDWFEAGVSIPIVFYESYRNPNAVPVPVLTRHTGLGDIVLETKFRILDNWRYPVGIAIVPLMTFPTGNSSFMMGNGKVTGGGKLAIEGNINNRVWMGMNFGYQFIPGRFQYFALNADAYIDDLLTFGLGIHGKINNQWSLIGEIYGETVARNAFKSLRQTPIIGRGGAKFTPKLKGAARGLNFTLAAGGGFTKGVGNPDFQVLGGIGYRRPHIVELEEPGAADVEARLEEKIIITQKIHFEFNRSNIRPISYPILNDVVELLKRNPQIAQVRVEGHTDWVGGDAYNKILSQRRAQSVVNYLVQHGVERSRLVPVGYGESRPIADNNTTEGRAKNRRTEFTVITGEL